MATYTNLSLDAYYLIRENEGGDITLVQPVMETGQCLLMLHIDEIETTVWKKKEDKLYEIIEELTEEQVAEYESVFGDEDEEEDDEWVWSDTGDSFEDEDEEEEENESDQAK